MDLRFALALTVAGVKVQPGKPGRVAIVWDEATDRAADDSQWESFGEEAAR